MKELLLALANAKKSFKPIVKNRQGYGYKYADLDEIQSKTDQSLADNGLLVIHSVSEGILTTALYHCSTGQSISSGVQLPVVSDIDTKKVQGLGACVTYYRRYNINMLLDLSAEEDSDGVVEPKTYKDKPAKIANTDGKITDSQLSFAKRIMVQNNIIAPQVVAILKQYSVEKVSDLKRSQFNHFLEDIGFKPVEVS